jgi:Ubiquitin-activating enzyme E1 four-helix bundle
MKFKSFEGSVDLTKNTPFDANLAVADFEKISDNDLSHLAFATLDTYIAKYNRKPAAWSLNDA